MRRALSAALLLVALFALWLVPSPAQQPHPWSVALHEDTGATPPRATAGPWRNADNGRIYHFSSIGDSLWLDIGEWYTGSNNAAAVSGELKYGHGIVFDTTRTAPDGFWRRDSSYISELTFSSERSGSGACTVDVFARRLNLSPLDTCFTWVTGGSGDDTVNVGAYVADSVRVMFAIRTQAASKPNRPIVRARLHYFEHPTP